MLTCRVLAQHDITLGEGKTMVGGQSLNHSLCSAELTVWALWSKSNYSQLVLRPYKDIDTKHGEVCQQGLQNKLEMDTACVKWGLE